MRLIVQVLPLLPENSRGAFRPPHLAAFKPRKFALPVEPDHTFEQVWKSIEDRYKRNYLTPAQASSFIIKKLQDAYDCDLDLGDTVASIFEGESDQEKRMIKVVPGFIDRDFSVPFTSNLRPAYAQKRFREINELNANKRQRVEGPLRHSLIPEVSPDKPLPSTESEGSDDNGVRNENQPMGENGIEQRRSRSKDSVIYVKGTQLEGANAGQLEIVPKRESPELGLLPEMRTIPESDEESEPRPLASQDNRSTQEERAFLKPTLPASMMNKRRSQEGRTEPSEPEETESGANEHANADTRQPQEDMEDIYDHSPSLHSSPKSDRSRNARGVPDSKPVSARQNVYDVFDSPEPKHKTTRRLTTYGNRFPRTPKLIQTSLNRSRSSSAKSASSRSERSVSARKNQFRVQEKDDIVSTPEQNDRSASVRAESPMYASKVLGIMREAREKRGSQSNLQNMTTVSPEAVMGNDQEPQTTPKVSPAQKPSSLKRPSKTSYQMPKPSTGSNSVNGERAAVNGSFKTPSKPQKHTHPFKSQDPDAEDNGSTTTTPLQSNSRETGSTPGTIDQRGSKVALTATAAKTVAERRVSTQILTKATSSSPHANAMAKIEMLKRNIAQRQRSNSTHTLNSHTPSSQIRRESVVSSVGQPEQSSIAASDVIETSEREGLKADGASEERDSVTGLQESPTSASKQDEISKEAPTATDTQQSPAPASQHDEPYKETALVAGQEESSGDNFRLESLKVKVSSKTVPRTENTGVPDLREQLVAASASAGPVDVVRSTSERPRSTPVRSAVPLPANVRALSSQVHIESASAHSDKHRKRVASVTHNTTRATPVPAPVEKSTKRRRGGKEDSPKPAAQANETGPVEGSDTRATPPAKRRKASARAQKAPTASSEAAAIHVKDNGVALTPAMLKTLLEPGKIKKEAKATPSPPIIPHSSEAVIELSSNSSDASSASPDIPFEGDLSLFPPEEEVQRSLQADSQREAGRKSTTPSPELGQEAIDHSSINRRKENGRHKKNQGGGGNSADLGDLPDAHGLSINGDHAEKVGDEIPNGTTAHTEIESAKDEALTGDDEEDTAVTASGNGNGSFDGIPSGQGVNASVSSAETESVAPLTTTESDDEEHSRKPARYLSRSPTPRSGSESPSSSGGTSEGVPDEPANGVVVNGDNNEDDKSTSSDSSSDTSSDEESDAHNDVEMPDAGPPASSPPTYAGQAKNRLAKQGMMMDSSQLSTSQSGPPISTPTPLPANIRSRASIAPSTTVRTRTSTTPATNPRSRKSMTPAVVKSSEATKPRPKFAKYPSLSQQVQQINRPTQASSPAKAFNPIEQSFTKLKGKPTANGKRNTKVFPVSDESESEEESSSDSSGDEILEKMKSKKQKPLVDKPRCSVV
jgi:hypothetical protein